MRSLDYHLAATLLVASKACAAELFEYEKTQLTQDALDTLKEPGRGWFAFDDGQSIAADEQRCKPLPEDSHYPNQTVWDQVKKTAKDRVIIPTVPRASSCYNGEHYDREDCDYLTKHWTDPHIQLVIISRSSSVTTALLCNEKLILAAPMTLLRSWYPRRRE